MAEAWQMMSNHLRMDLYDSAGKKVPHSVCGDTQGWLFSRA